MLAKKNFALLELMFRGIRDIRKLWKRLFWRKSL